MDRGGGGLKFPYGDFVYKHIDIYMMQFVGRLSSHPKAHALGV